MGSTGWNEHLLHWHCLIFYLPLLALTDTTRGLITLGTHIFGGLEQKGIKDLKNCIKKCATAGGGIAANTAAITTTPQLCFGIDYNFGTHKCYFHTNSGLCPTTVVTPAQLTAMADSINILLCKYTIIYLIIPIMRYHKDELSLTKIGVQLDSKLCSF